MVNLLEYRGLHELNVCAVIDVQYRATATAAESSFLEDMAAYRRIARGVVVVCVVTYVGV